MRLGRWRMLGSSRYNRIVIVLLEMLASKLSRNAGRLQSYIHIQVAIWNVLAIA